MALVVKDRVKELTTTTGTANLTLGGAVSGFQSFSIIGSGNQTYYGIYDATTGDWEVGVGTYSSSGPTLTRDTVFESSNAGSKVSFSAGAKSVFCTYPAERSVYLDAAGSAVTALDIGTLGTSTANITTANITSGTVSTTPTSSNDLVNKSYVDGISSQGISYHAPVKYEVPSGNLNATYNNGSSGVGATLTNAGTLTAFTPDGVVAQAGDRILIYNQTNAAQNGVYTVTTVGSGSVAWVLTRATDANSYGAKDPNKLGGGDAFYVTSGNTGAGETYVCNNSNAITFGTTPITFAQVSSAQVYSAGTGLTLSNLQFSLTPVGTAATYGSASTVPVFTTNSTGQITSVTNTGISITSAAVSGLAASATTDTTNAANISSGTLNSARLSGSYTGITGVGTLTAGTWNATAIAANYGGTGQTSYTVGDLLYASGTTALSKLAGVVAGNALISGGVGTAPSWGKIGLQTHISGTLQVANGGTGGTTAADARTNLSVPATDGTGASGTWGINVTGSSGSVTGLTLNNINSPINPDNVTQNQLGYNTSVSLFGQTDGGLYSSAYSSVWIHQIYGDFRTGQIAIRGKNNGTWQAWRTVLDSGNYNSYAPTLTGTGASGTWGINVTGSAGSVAWGNVTSKPSNIMFYEGFTLDANTMSSNSTGFTYSVNAPYTGPIARFSTGGGYDLWLNAPYSGGAVIAFRTRNGDTGTLNPWYYPAIYGVSSTSAALYAGIYYDSQDTTYYCDPASTSYLNNLLTLNAVSNNSNGLRNVNPGGGSFVTGSTTITGAIKIKLPENVFPMIRFTVRVYTYDGQSFDIYCGGHTSGGLWYNTFAYMGTQYRAALNVRFTNDGTNVFVCIGELATAWSYPQVFITDVQVGYTNYEYTRWDDGWQITFETSTFNNVNATQAVYPFTSSTSNNYAVYGSAFYDASNTAYSIDGNVSAAWRISTPSGYLELGPMNSGFCHFQTDRASFYFAQQVQFDSNAIDYSGNWALYDGFGIHNGSFRAPIFYDSDDTTWYCNPNGTSVFNSLQMWDPIYSYNSDSETLFQSYNTSAGSAGQFNIRHSFGDVIIENYRGWIYQYGSAIQTNNSYRAPIFYDSNDTTYYIDPNSPSDAALRMRGGALFGPNTSWNKYLLIGGNGRSAYTDNADVASVCTTNGNLHIDAASGFSTYINFYDGDILYFGNGASGIIGQVSSGGNATFSGNVTAYGSPSDRRLKKNIQPIQNALATVLSLRGRTFEWVDESDEFKMVGLRGDIGFIADEVQETLPQFVREGSDGYLTLRDRGFAALLVEAVKELSAKVDALK